MTTPLAEKVMTSYIADSGDDFIDGGEGTDTADGGPGFDTCVNVENPVNCEA